MDGEIRRLDEQLRAAVEGPTWAGQAVLEVLEGVTAEQAARHPVPGAHSIWELVLHVGSDYALLLRRLAGDARPLAPEEGWPACPPATPDNWRVALDTLLRSNRRLREAVRAFPPERLDAPLVADVPFSAHAQFIGVTQHNLYHAGQIAVLKRALAAEAGAT